jgi:uncharacterized membrane protein YraQ (UPF0718 family)
MLASPILNPVVLASTWVAYGGRGLGAQMVAARAALGLTVALVAGWAVAGEGIRVQRRQVSSVTHAAGKGQSFVEHLSNDLFFMGRFLVAGAALAAALQTLVPQSLGRRRGPDTGAGVPGVDGSRLSPITLLRGGRVRGRLVCALPVGSQLAFLVFGPVVDAKLALLYGATFGRRFVARVIAVAIPVILAGSLWFEVLLQ